MNGFEEGYEFFTKNSSSYVASNLADNYIDAINKEIDKLENDINSFKGFASSVDTLKGDVAEFWHADTYNIQSAINGSSNRAYVDRSHEMGSVDISTSFGKQYGLKYYKSGQESAKQQAKSIFEKFNEYQAKGGKEKLDEYLLNSGYSDDVVLSDPIYSGQMRLIPSEQLKDAANWLKLKIIKESITRPDEVKRYQETYNLLTDKIRDNQGNESIVLSSDEAKRLSVLGKEGKFDPKKIGLTTEEMIHFENILKESFKAGLTSATIAMVLNMAPEIINAFKFLVDNGEIDKEKFKEIGFAAIEGAGDGFIKGTLSAVITSACKSGMLGESLKKVDPSIIGTVVVITVDTLKNTYELANGRMTKRELANELIKEMFVSTCSLVGGTVAQSYIEIPVFGFMIGSFAGSILGSVVYDSAYKPAMSFCVSTGFTMFGLVEQNYELPEDVLKEIGIDVFEYEKFDYQQFEPERFEYTKFTYNEFKPESIDIRFLRRGVIGISKIGFI